MFTNKSINNDHNNNEKVSSSIAKTIDFSKLEPGDLIFIRRATGFNGHVCAIMPSKCNGIYNRFLGIRESFISRTRLSRNLPRLV